MKPKLYIETTIPSYLAAWPSRDRLRAEDQQITQEWWRSRGPDFELYVSQLVIDEVSQGDKIAAKKRLETLKDFPVLEASRESDALAEELLRSIPLPSKAAADAQHIAIAAVNGMNYLLTWNCAHIANPTLRAHIEEICRSRKLNPPIIRTPSELMGEEIR